MGLTIDNQPKSEQPNLTPMEAFNDALIELEQYRNLTDTPSSRVLEQDECAEVIQNLEQLVVDEPSVVDFYRGALIGYRKNNPDSIQEERAVIEDRICLMDDLGLIGAKRKANLFNKLETGELVYEEAKVFFRLFKHVIEPDRIPRDRYKTRRKPPKKPVEETLEEPELATAQVETVPPSDNRDSSGEQADVVAETKHLGWEYDEMVQAYRDHPLNKPTVRYQRDCEGFNTEPLKPLGVFDTESHMAFLVAHSRRFPLLDGLAHEKQLKEKIEKGKDAFLEMQGSVVEPEQLEKLEQLAIEGAGAFITFYECNIRIAISFGRKLLKESQAHSLADSTASALVALRRAIQKYDPEKGFKFSTYAVKWMQQSVSRGHKGVLFDVSMSVATLRKVNEIKAKQAKLQSGKITDEELLEQGYSSSEILASKIATREPISIDAPVNTEGDTALKELLSGDDVDFDSWLENEDRIREIHDIVLQGIPQGVRELEVITLKSGVIVPNVDYSKVVSLNGYGRRKLGEVVEKVRSGEISLSYEDIGEAIGVTAERTRQLYEQTVGGFTITAALDKIRDRLNMDEGEYKTLLSYMQYLPPGKRSEQVLDARQQEASETVSLLSLLDEDVSQVIEQSVAELANERGFGERTLSSIRGWLHARYDSNTSEGTPLSTKILKEYGLSNTIRLQSEAVFLGALSGVRDRRLAHMQKNKQPTFV